ncbi:hypothetical protein B0T16DRAFT_454342 [Cercophora newfieldiana]|uniref:Urease accessory protein UreF n=1 Tax=Cercophora newfieldiana TaxID=92897 RepID=A0AA39YI17_9PEZI|nr:hypothetical protein B0T16DRAFT_454342 [Cercophora newfieldiana]
MTNPKNTPEPNPADDELALEIADLERRLAAAKAKASLSLTPPPPISTAANHFLLLLSDSALPLGSFAFSSGLESYLAHHKSGHHPRTTHASFTSFLPLSISSYASTTLPFALAAYRNPSTANLVLLDDTLDATIICTVGRRASIAQGRALLSIWERSLAAALPREKADGLRGFAALLKAATTTSGGGGGGGEDDPPAVSAHLAPLFGAICRLSGLSCEQTAYVFMLGHVKALVSAAVRAGMFGPYQAQKTLAGPVVQGLINAVVAREWETPVEMAGQCVPVMDLWFGRHEVLYSRIFNS